MDETTPSRPTLLETFKAVGWAFFGVRSGKAHRSDFSRLNPIHVIVVGLVAAGLFIGLLVLAVRLMMRAAGAG